MDNNRNTVDRAGKYNSDPADNALQAVFELRTSLNKLREFAIVNRSLADLTLSLSDNLQEERERQGAARIAHEIEEVAQASLETLSRLMGCYRPSKRIA